MAGENFHHVWGEDVHAEKAEVMAGAQTGNDQFLFGFGRSGFLQQVLDFVEALAARNQASADRAVIREFAFVGCLDSGDRAVLSPSDLYQLLGGAFFRAADV